MPFLLIDCPGLVEKSGVQLFRDARLHHEFQILLPSCMLSHLSLVWLFVTTWTVAHQVALSMGFSSQEYLEWFAIPSSRGSSWPRNKPTSPATPVLQMDSLPLSHQGSPLTTFAIKLILTLHILSTFESFLFPMSNFLGGSASESMLVVV